MKKQIAPIIAIIILLSVRANSFCQNVIAVEHLGTSTFYQNLDSALNHAENGDMVYLPPATFSIGSTLITKGVHLVGAGCNFDSSAATGVTMFVGNLHICTGSDNGSLEGIYVNGGLTFGYSGTVDGTVNNYSIRRCVLQNGLCLRYNCGSTAPVTNILITENIIKGAVSLGSAQQVEVSKNIIEHQVSEVNGNTLITNNVFLFACGPEFNFQNINAASIQNNIFAAVYCNVIASYQLQSGGSGNLYQNNIFIGPAALIPGGNISSNNFFDVSHDSIYVYQTGQLYDITHNYHLRPTCIGKNAGTDGTDIGIYGTASPKKEGEVPYNPHIQYKAIPASTNSQGNLNINIKVKAQDN